MVRLKSCNIVLLIIVLFRVCANSISNDQLSDLIKNEPHRILKNRNFIELMITGVNKKLIPISYPPGSFNGFQLQESPFGVPKRNWRKGKKSNSLSRHLQHLFMYSFIDSHGSKLLESARLEGRKVRCLDWDGWYAGSIFHSLCQTIDVIEYATPFGKVRPKSLYWSFDKSIKATNWYYADAHNMSLYLENNAYDIVIANSVFEHFYNPFIAMKEVYKILRPNGYLFWHTPFQFEEHGVPHDYFRYTVAAAKHLAQSSGLKVELCEADGGYAAVVSNIFGIGSKFWSDDILLRVYNTSSSKNVLHPRHYLSTRMLAIKE